MAKARIDPQKGVYLLGEQVAGSLHFSLDKPVSQRSAAAFLMGKERTQVNYQTTVHTGKGSHSQTETAVQESEFLHQEFPIPLPMDEEGKFKPGDYSIPFGFTLPQGLPTAYSGKNVRIMYAIVAKIDVPHWRDIKETSEFVVAPSSPQTVQPQPVDAVSASSGDPRKPGIKFTLEKSECRRGEALSGRCSFINPPSKSLRDIDVALRWIETATAQGHTATTEIRKETSKIPIGGKVYQGGSPFTIRIPQEAPLTYTSALSNLRCTLSVGLDISLGSDVAARAEIRVLP